MVTPARGQDGSSGGGREGRPWLVALGAVALAAMGVDLVLRLPAAVSLNYGEGFLLFDALREARGGDLYGDPSRVPWTIQTYTPLYLWLVSLAARLGAEGYAAARLIGYASLLATALVVARAGRGRSGATAWGVAALYLTLPLFVSWGAAVRPDNLAVLLAALGVSLADDLAGRRAVLWTLPLFLASGLAKQSTVAAPAAALLWLALRDRGAAWRFAALGAAGLGLSLGVLELGSGGWFWLHAVESHAAKPYRLEQLAGVCRAFLAFHALPAAAGLALMLFLARRGRLSATWLWLALSGVAAAASAGKSGSDTNYFLEPAAALALLAARELPPPRELRPGARAWVGAGALALAAWHLFVHLANSAWIPGAEERFRLVVERFDGVEGPVLSDDAGFLLASGRPLWLQPFIMTQLAAAGLWDEGPVVDGLRAGDFALVIVQRQPAAVFRSRYTPAMRRALAERYGRVDAYRTEFELEVLAPRRTGP